MESQLTELALYIAFASFALAALALVFAARGDRRKTGIDIRSSFSVASAVWSKEQWVAEVRLENVKDRSITIYKIYLEIDHGLYIEVEDFTENPKKLGPYSVFQKKYDPIEFYSHGMKRLTGVLGEHDKRRRIVLLTSQGRHNSKSGIRMKDDPMLDIILKNHWTGVVRPERWSFKGRCYGSEAKYIVTFVGDDGKEEIVPIYPRDHEISKFREFKLTGESLESKQALEFFLRTQIAVGKLSCSTFEVFDLEPFRRRMVNEYSGSMAVAHQGWFSYNVLGRCVTVWEKWAMDRKNKKLRAGK